MKEKIRIIDVFSSIQGEGLHQGRSCLFIRTVGCNLRFSHCDTKESWNEQAGADYIFSELFSIIKRSKCSMLEITGGEPLHLWKEELGKFFNKYLNDIYKSGIQEVLIETNGSINISPLHFYDIRFIMDVKPPEIKGGDFCIKNFKLINESKSKFELKFLVGSKEHIGFIYSFLGKNKNLICLDTIINISPIFSSRNKIVFDCDWSKLIMDLESKFDKFIFRLNIQIHKIVGVK